MKNRIPRQKLRTVHLVPLTAYDADGKISFELQKQHSARMAKAGISVFLPAAGTSEFHSLTADEILEVVRATRAGAGPEAVIFAPVGLQVGHAIDVGKRAKEAGADGIMFMPFSHPYLSGAGMKDYYLQVMKAVQLPTLIYKKGPFPSDALLLEFAEHPDVIGVKYAENNMHDFRRTVLKDGGRIEWLCGSAERFSPFYMLVGSTGYTTGAGNLCPHITLAMHAALAAGQYEEALRYQEAILPIEDFRAREGDSYNISMLKEALRQTGVDFGPPRPPQRQLTVAEKEEIARIMVPINRLEEQLAKECRHVGLTRV
ncbi:MAG: dihydrodipicolinate synthase family protein [Planctomycetales bacterium]